MITDELLISAMGRHAIVLVLAAREYGIPLTNLQKAITAMWNVFENE